MTWIQAFEALAVELLTACVLLIVILLCYRVTRSRNRLDKSQPRFRQFVMGLVFDDYGLQVVSLSRSKSRAQCDFLFGVWKELPSGFSALTDVMRNVFREKTGHYLESDSWHYCGTASFKDGLVTFYAAKDTATVSKLIGGGASSLVEVHQLRWLPLDSDRWIAWCLWWALDKPGFTVEFRYDAKVEDVVSLH